LPAHGEAALAAEVAARDAYGRLVALLARHSGDLGGAEDALADAFVAALERWPLDGVPANPPAWLLTVARRRKIDAGRRRAHSDLVNGEVGYLAANHQAGSSDPARLPDHRLELLLACAHPAIDVAARTPLMLQAVLGLTAERMASAFLASPAAMTKRLVRAKAKLAASGVRFEVPDDSRLDERLEPVLNAIYAAFTIGEADSRRSSDLTGEALWLGRLLTDLLPSHPEVLGLQSLMLLIAGRRFGTTLSRPEHYTPLSEQDPGQWNDALLTRAEVLLRRAGTANAPGRFQLEAAIQAVHVNRRRSGITDWPVIVELYDRLLERAPLAGARIARAAAIAQAGEPLAALAALEAINDGLIAAHQPYWATRAYALALAGRGIDAADAYERAAGLTEWQAARAWLLARREALKI
jgi:RNA polymerase sigma-70 factor (ECF subfamily)